MSLTTYLTTYEVVEPYLAKRQASWQTRLGTARFISVLVLVLSLVCAFISESLNINLQI